QLFNLSERRIRSVRLFGVARVVLRPRLFILLRLPCSPGIQIIVACSRLSCPGDDKWRLLLSSGRLNGLLRWSPPIRIIGGVVFALRIVGMGTGTATTRAG